MNENDLRVTKTKKALHQALLTLHSPEYMNKQFFYLLEGDLG